MPFATCTSPFLGACLPTSPRPPIDGRHGVRTTDGRIGPCISDTDAAVGYVRAAVPPRPTVAAATYPPGLQLQTIAEAAAESDCESDYESSDDELTQEELDELDALDGRGHLRPNQVSVWSIVPVPAVALARRGKERHTPTDLSFARVSHGCVSGTSQAIVVGHCVCLMW